MATNGRARTSAVAAAAVPERSERRTDDPVASREPAWLSDTEQVAWLGAAAMVLQLPGVLDNQLQRDSGLGLFEYLVLSSLSMADGRMLRMSELAGLANGSLSRLSNVVKRLEQRQWVRREPDPQDGRYTVAILTDAGWDLVVEAAPGHVHTVRHYLLDPLTATQIRQLGDIGRRVGQRIHSTPPALDRAAGGDCCEPETSC